MTIKLTALSLALVAGVALPALAERDAPGPGGMGPMAMPSFAELDTDKSDTLTLDELKAFRADMFANADTNKDGGLSAEEMTAAAKARIEATLPQRIQAMVTRLDTDKNGALSQEELAARDKGPDFDRMFGRLDRNNDGVLSADEYAALQDRMDRHDGPMMGGPGEHGKDEHGQGWKKR